MVRRFGSIESATTALLLVALIGGCAPDRRLPVSQQPSLPSTQSSNGSVDYGEEVSRLVSADDEIVSTLRNGLVVIVKRVPASPVVSVRGYAMTGGAFEGKWLGGGLSHLLEHLVAGGSNGRRTEEQNRDLLQSIGNNSNAYTSADRTVFFVNTTTANLEPAVDLVTGWMFTAAITEAEYRREYEVVQRELEKDFGEPDSVFQDLTTTNRYRVSPARVPTIGYQEVIQGLTRDDVYSYYKLAYQPNNMIFAVAGDLPPQAMLDAVRKHVRGVPPGRAFSHEVAPEPDPVGPRALVATFPKLGSARLQLGFPSISLDHPDLYALDLLSMVLGGSEGAILVEEVRDKRQLVESISCSSDTPHFVAGTFTVEMNVATEKVRDATAAVMEVVERVKSQPIDESRIERAKTLVRVQHVRSRESCEEIIDDLASNYLTTGDPHFSDRYLERIERVTAAELQDVAKRYLVPGKLLTTALVPSESAGSESLPAAVTLLRRAAAPTTTASATRPAEASKITRVQIGRGVTLLHRRITTSPTVAIRLVARGGVTREDESNNGIGNLAMELLTRGTKKRSARQIAEQLESTGAEVGTSSGTQTWAWNATCLTENFDATVDLLQDIVGNPAFADDEVAAMKQRVLARIEAQDSDWFSQGMRFFKTQYFGPMKSPYRFLPIGTVRTVDSLNSSRVREYYEKTITAEPRVIAIFGDVSLEQARAAASKFAPTRYAAPASGGRTFESSGETAIASGTPITKPVVNVRRVEVQKTEQPVAGIFIGFKSDSTYADDRRFAFDIADCMVSGYGYPTGYIFDTLRGLGISYQADANDIPGLSSALPGCFGAYAACDPDKVNEAIDNILLSIARLQDPNIASQRDWFERSKRLIITQDALDSETAHSQAERAALDELFGRGYDAQEQFAQRINGVTLEQLRDVARAYLSECVITVSTPAPDLVNQATGVRTYDAFPPINLTPRGVQHDTGAAGK